jgi:3-deoxy-D-manno-octulosonate 8-phosphate phosphatase (KDO 8-P phosphatase)
MSDIILAALATPDVLARARKIKLFLMDVDGTLTDGGVCLISATAGRSSPAVAKRAEELKVTYVYLGQAKKSLAFEECMQKAGVTEDEIAYMGDDLPDIPLAKRAGLAVCVADGAPELKAVCHFTTSHLAGRGTAREVVELILKAQGRWEEAVPLALA